MAGDGARGVAGAFWATIGAAMPNRAAVLYIPRSRHGAALRWWTECWQTCQARRYGIHAITDDPGTARWLVAAGRADVVVVARPVHARRVALAVAVACDPPDRLREPGRPRRLRPPEVEPPPLAA